MAEPPKNAEAERAPSKRIGALRGLLPFLKPYTLLLAGASFALVLTAALSLVLPLAVRRVVDGFETAASSLLDGYFAAALGLTALIALGTGLRYYMVTRLGERVVADIRKSVFDRTIGMSPAFFEQILTGEVISRITTDTTLIQSVIGSSVSWFLRNMLLFFGGMALMIWTSPKLAGLVLLIVPAVLGPIIILGRRIRNLSRENQDWIAASSGNASEQLLSVQTVQAFTHEGASRNRFDDITEKSFQAALKRTFFRAAMTTIIIAVVFAGIVGVLWIGARDVREGAITIGVLVQFVIYAAMVAGSAAALSEIWGELQRAAGATERLIELLNLVDSVNDPDRPHPLPEAGKAPITFDDVVFHYPTRPSDPALNGVSFEVAPGETVALVGPSGAGKSTVIQLMLRFYDPQSGAIRLGGVDLRQMIRAEFRAALSLVPQDPVIFADTARENIRFGRPSATDAEVEAAAQAAAADGFLRDLPDGYDTYVGERGVMLSGGQRQRIAIARAILRNAPILLLDEATSALDAESEQAVQSAVENMSEGRTTIIVAHRLATVKRADRILVFDKGRIVASGTHDSLVRDGGLYARLARLQFTDGLDASTEAAE
ncbi:MAG: ABC transporter transmembrane domain-containing protein [Pseudomonadota bacterium]